MGRLLGCEPRRQLRSRSSLAHRHFWETVYRRFFMPEALPIVSTVPKPLVAQNLLLCRPAPVAHIAVGSHPDENEVGRNVLIH